MIKHVRADALAHLREVYGRPIVHGWGLAGVGPALFGWWALWPTGRAYLGPTLSRALAAPMALSAAAEQAKDRVKCNGLAILIWREEYGAWVEMPLAPGEHPRRALLAARRRYAAALLESPTTLCTMAV